MFYWNCPSSGILTRDCEICTYFAVRRLVEVFRAQEGKTSIYPTVVICDRGFKKEYTRLSECEESPGYSWVNGLSNPGIETRPPL